MRAHLTRRMRCAVYTRKSTEEGLDQEYNSIDAQRDAGHAYIASQRAEGWIPLGDDYDDPAYSGGNMDRPALKRLLVDIEAGKVDIVVVYKIDRLTRSLTDFSRMIDLIDRVIHVDLPTIPSEARRDDADCHDAWERDRPQVFGALLDLFVEALRRLPSVKLTHKQRMADYERLGEAVARALGFAPGEFQRQYAELVRAGIDRVLESNAVAQVLDKYFENRINPWDWQGTAGQLYELLNSQIIPDRSTWPKSPKGLSDQLRRIAPAYRAKGIEISHLGHRREGAIWRIARTPDHPDSPATPPGGSHSTVGGLRYGVHRE